MKIWALIVLGVALIGGAYLSFFGFSLPTLTGAGFSAPTTPSTSAAAMTTTSCYSDKWWWVLGIGVVLFGAAVLLSWQKISGFWYLAPIGLIMFFGAGGYMLYAEERGCITFERVVILNSFDDVETRTVEAGQKWTLKAPGITGRFDFFINRVNSNVEIRHVIEENEGDGTMIIRFLEGAKVDFYAKPSS